jgi:phage terminase large subunit-like protein
MSDPRLQFVLDECILPIGKAVGEAIAKDPWVTDKFLGPIFERNRKGFPKHSLCYLEMGRGSWKSGGLAATAIAEAVLFPQTEIIICAVDVDQAKIDLDALDGYIRQNPRLAALFKSRDRGDTRHVEGGSRIRVISADVPGAWGLGGTSHRFRVYCEELSEWRSEELWSALASATGKAPDSQIVVASNAGWDRQRAWQFRIRETARVERWGYLYAPPGPHASWISPEWVEQQKALLPPIAFERVILNRWTSQTGDYISRSAWRRLVDPGLHPVARGSHGRYFGGLDLGLTRDRTAFAICHVEHQRIVLDALEVWEGTPADPVSIVAVENHVRDAYRRFPGLVVHADPWQAEGTVQKLSRGGHRIEKFRFSQASIHHLSRVLYECAQDESLRVYEDDGLEQEVLGLQVRETPEGWRFDHRAGGYSDRVVALAMALQAAVRTRVRRAGKTWSSFAVTRSRQEGTRQLPEGFVWKGAGVVADPSLAERPDPPPGFAYAPSGYLVRRSPATSTS